MSLSRTFRRAVERKNGTAAPKQPKGPARPQSVVEARRVLRALLAASEAQALVAQPAEEGK